MQPRSWIGSTLNDRDGISSGEAQGFGTLEIDEIEIEDA